MGSSELTASRWRLWRSASGLLVASALLVPLLVLGGTPGLHAATAPSVGTAERPSVPTAPVWSLFPAHLTNTIDVLSPSTVVVPSVVTNRTHVDGRAACSFDLQLAVTPPGPPARVSSGGIDEFVTRRVPPGHTIRIDQSFTNGNVDRVVDLAVRGPYPRVVSIDRTGLYCHPLFSTTDWAYEHPGVPEPPFASLVGVSCAAIDSCMAIGYRYVPREPGVIAERWNGHGWSVAYATTASRQLTGVSCPTTNWCMLIGDDRDDATPTRDGFAIVWSAGRVTAHTPNLDSPQLNAVSCVGALSCVVVGSYVLGDRDVPLEARWNGSTWSVMLAAHAADDLELTSVSCTSTSNCMAIGTGGTSYPPTVADRWNGRTWSSLTMPSSGHHVRPTCDPRAMGCLSVRVRIPVLRSVSCGSASTCLAIGTQGLVESWAAGRWVIVRTPAHLVAVSCASADACDAVGFEGVAVQEPVSYGWNGSGWTRNSPSPSHLSVGGATFFGVSCPSRNACVAVGKVIDYPVSGPDFLVLWGTRLAGTWSLRT